MSDQLKKSQVSRDDASRTVRILRPVLIFLARATIVRYHPRIVGVTGSVGKTSTKRAIATVLGKSHRVRMAEGNLNNEIGMSLTILGSWRDDELALVSRAQPAGTAKRRKLFFWIKVLFMGTLHLIVKSKSYPEILILEYGADRPGDILRLMRIALPDTGVVTAIGDVPVHVEFYETPEAVAREKSRLIERLFTGNAAILNHDDPRVNALRDRTRARILTYGFESDADLRVIRLENRVVDGIPMGISFKFEYEGSLVPVRIDGSFGRAPAAAAAAAACVGLIFNMNLVTISEVLAEYVPAPSRMELLLGMKRTFLIDDTYNASPLSMREAIDTLSELPASRKIAVLGDMLEIGKYTVAAHEEVGRHIAGLADVLMTVGPRAKFIAAAAQKAGMKKEYIHSFDTAEEVIQPLVGVMTKGDIVLLKASHAVGLEAVVNAVMAEPLATGEV